MCSVFTILILKGFMIFWSQKSPCILLNKNINFNKNKRESKMENPIHGSERWTLWFCSNKNRKLKGKLWWVGARERKKRASFVPFILSGGNFFNICACVLNTLSEYTYYYISKNITLYTFFCLFSKSSKAFQCVLNTSTNGFDVIDHV